MSNKFDSDRSGRGTFEWADWTENIQRGCANECLYCYAAHNAIVKFKNVVPGEWKNETFTGRVRMKSYPKREGIGMFPTVHDITPFNVDECIRVLTLMLQAGNKVLIVTKPNMSCMIKVFAALAEFKDQIMFRFTIGAFDESAIKFWEPGAPSASERIAVLMLAYKKGFRTSVSMEPFLSSVDDTIELVKAIRSFVTDSIWIGKMNKTDDRVLEANPEMIVEMDKIKSYQTDTEIFRLIDALDNDNLVWWKDSIKQVVENA